MSAEVFSRAIQGFGLEFHKHAKKEDNVFVSPLSMYTGVGMIYLGAKNQTQSNIAKGLGFSGLSEAEVHAVLQNLRLLNNTQGVTLASANRVYIQKDFTILPEYIDALKKHFEAEAKTADFIKQEKETREEINGWVEGVTKSKIKDLIGDGMLNPSTRVVIVNAVYFKGNWAEKFKIDQTKKEPFTKHDGQQVQVDMMHDLRDFNFTVNDELDCKALQLNYEQEKTSMLLFLPNKDGAEALTKLRSTLSAAAIKNVVDNLNSVEVHVALPRFKIEHTVVTESDVPALGLVDVFEGHGDPDFSGITGQKNLAVSTIVHKAFIEVNEEGTEAAAATGMIMKCMAYFEPMTFFCERPFFFVIRENESGAILFSGELTNPTTA